MGPVPPQLLAYLELVRDRCKDHYGEELTSLVLYGSVVRGTFRPTSDLDLLVVLSHSTLSWGKRISQFLNAVLDHADVERAASALKRTNLPWRIEPIILTESELAARPPLLLDLTEDAMILEDRVGVFAQEIARVRRRLDELGARRVWLPGDRWYWILREHDVSDVLVGCAGRFPEPWREVLPELAKRMREITPKRGPAMYGLEAQVIPASEAFDEEEGRGALADAEFVYRHCAGFFEEWRARRL